MQQAISIHAPREGGDYKRHLSNKQLAISIHAPREGGDRIHAYGIILSLDISIHAPREGGDRKTL